MTADNGEVVKACVVSVEVDGRQRYVFESDKLREMLGASRLIDGTRAQAEELFKGELHLFSPVSGEIRAWAMHEKRTELLNAVWALREWLDQAGIGYTIAYLETDVRSFEEDDSGFPDLTDVRSFEEDDSGFPDLTDVRSFEKDDSGFPDLTDVRSFEEDGSDFPALTKVHRDIGGRARAIKAGKPGSAARPWCSLFVPCAIHGCDPATRWAPGKDPDGERRRELVGFRARKKYEAWRTERDSFYDELLFDPVKERLEFLKPNHGVNLSRAITYRDLSDRMDGAEPRGDQYIAFLCADGDGMGNLLTGLRWNSGWKGKEGNKKPWERNRDLSVALDEAVRNAMGHAIAAAALPDEKAAQAFLDRVQETKENEKVHLNLPLLPQLFGGDDVWIVADRKCVLDLAISLATKYQALAADKKQHDGIINALAAGEEQHKGIINRAREVAKQTEPLTISFGIAFAKAGHPAHAMVEAAESLMRSAKALRKGKLATCPAGVREGCPARVREGCLDWHWIESSLVESIDEARALWRYEDGDQVLHLTTRPWTVSETSGFIKASRRLALLPRRKREQIETIVRLGYKPSLLAWEAWWKGLDSGTRMIMQNVNKDLPKRFKLPEVAAGPWCDLGDEQKQQTQNDVLDILAGPWCNLGDEQKPRRMTPLLDLLALQHVFGIEGQQPAAGEASTEGESDDRN